MGGSHSPRIGADWDTVDVLNDKQAHTRWLLEREFSRLRTFTRPAIIRVLTSRFLAPCVVISIFIELGLFFALAKTGTVQLLGPALLLAGLLGGLALWSLMVFDRQQADRDTLLRLALGEPMTERSFERIDLTGTPLSGTRAEAASFRNAKLMSVDLSVASLSYSNFAGAMAGYADFSGSEMESVEASHGEFAYATFAQANLDSASFIFADLRNADLSGADLRNADFSGADLRGADLRNATTLGTRFEGAISSSTTLWPEAFLGPSHREERGLDELAETATIDLRSHRALVGGVAAVAMLIVGLSFAKATGTDPVAPSKVEVLGERANRVSYLVTGTAAVVEITLTNELNGSEVFEAITPFHRIMSVPQGYQLELRAKVQGNGSATCSIEGASGILSEAAVQGEGSTAVCAATAP